MSSLNLSRILFYDDEKENQQTDPIVDEKEKFYLSDSMCELGQVAVISSSKASLKYRATNPNESRVSLRRKESLLKKPEKDGESQLDPDVVSQKNLTQVKGTIYGVISALSYCSSNVMMKKSKWLSPTDHSAIRYLVSLIVMVIICKYNDLKLLGPRKAFKLLFVRGLIGSFSLLAFYSSIMLLTPSSSTSLIHMSIIITAVMSRFCLGERLTIAHFIAIALTANGVLFISKPSFLFSSDDLLIQGNETLTESENTESTTFETLKTVVGN